MVIDKTTGKGCALSIVSKTVTKQLIADGIIGKTIFKKTYKNGCGFLCVSEYGTDIKVLWKKGRLAEEPLWAPSFIDTGLWQQAVSKFRDFTDLDENVEEYLLPQMDEYLQGIPESELVSMTRDFLLGYGVINKPISQHGGKTYYFNEDEVYSADKEERLFPNEKRSKFNIFMIRGQYCINMNVWRKATSQFKVGMTLNECISVFLKTELVHNNLHERSPVDRLVQSIAPPVFERVPGNTDESTFDRIRVTVGLPRYHFNSWEALRQEIKKYRTEMDQLVLQRLEQGRQFKKYGVPINCLKVSDITLLRDFSMEYIFELKDLKADSLL